ncbi:(deoxy)nucleoside triphosphate pyrophosphohydrolase [Desulfovibrio sp.]
MSRREIRVVAGIIWRGREFLAVDRPEGKDFAHMWEFPGGKIGPGESAEDALVRELREELRITATSFSAWREKRHDYAGFTVHLTFFHVHAFMGEPYPAEGQALAWVRPEEPGGLAFLPADVEILEALKRYDGPRGEGGRVT